MPSTSAMYEPVARNNTHTIKLIISTYTNTLSTVTQFLILSSSFSTQRFPISFLTPILSLLAFLSFLPTLSYPLSLSLPPKKTHTCNHTLSPPSSFVVTLLYYYNFLSGVRFHLLRSPSPYLFLTTQCIVF